MSRVLPASVLLLGLVAACGKTATEDDTGSESGALGAYRDGCDAAACGPRPAPKHPCVGGYPANVCTRARGTCGWQVDCVADPPAGYDGNVGVSSCGTSPSTASECGPLPVYDDKDCVHGFLGVPQCESYDRAACAWSRRCAPPPCDQTGTCNALDRSKLAGPCDAQTPCPSGYSCASISVNIDESIAPTCIEQSSCPLTCAAGKSCLQLDSYPAQVICGKD